MKVKICLRQQLSQALLYKHFRPSEIRWSLRRFRVRYPLFILLFNLASLGLVAQDHQHADAQRITPAQEQPRVLRGGGHLLGETAQQFFSEDFAGEMQRACERQDWKIVRQLAKNGSKRK